LGKNHTRDVVLIIHHSGWRTGLGVLGFICGGCGGELGALFLEGGVSWDELGTQGLHVRGGVEVEWIVGAKFWVR